MSSVIEPIIDILDNRNIQEWEQHSGELAQRIIQLRLEMRRSQNQEEKPPKSVSFSNAGANAVAQSLSLNTAEDIAVLGLLPSHISERIPWRWESLDYPSFRKLRTYSTDGSRSPRKNLKLGDRHVEEVAKIGRASCRERVCLYV